MNARIFCFCLLHLPIMVFSQDFSGSYEGSYEGAPVRMQLNKTNNHSYEGILDDSHNQYKVTATSSGNQLTGTCKEQNLGVQLTLNGHLQGSALSLKLEFWGTLIPLELQKKPSNHSASAPHQDQRQRDPALVGKWVRQSNYNSSGFGQGNMATETSLVLLADGQVADGGSRAVVGGSGWSGSSSKQGGSILPGLIWYTQNRQLYLQITEHGQTQVQLLGSYYVENQNMLVTGTDGTKVLYYKQIE
jgi:hypothetical protein